MVSVEVPFGDDRFPSSMLTQDLRPFGFAQGSLWAIICRPYGAHV